MSSQAARFAVVMPAAGLARRFGGMKLLANVGGVPLIERTLTSVLDAGAALVVVVVRDGALFDGVPATRDPRVRIVVNMDPERGMFSSVQAGLAAADGEVIAVLPADMPFVSPATVSAIVAHAREHDRVVVPAFDGRGGHPVGIPGRWRLPLMGLPAATTLKAALAAIAGAPVPLPVGDRGVVRDVDRPLDIE